MNTFGFPIIAVGVLLFVIGGAGYLYFGFFRHEIGEKRTNISFAIAALGSVTFFIGERILGYSLFLQIANNIGR